MKLSFDMVFECSLFYVLLVEAKQLTLTAFWKTVMLPFRISKVRMSAVLKMIWTNMSVDILHIICAHIKLPFAQNCAKVDSNGETLLCSI